MIFYYTKWLSLWQVRGFIPEISPLEAVLLNSQRFGRIIPCGSDRAIRLNNVFAGRNSARQKRYTASIPCALLCDAVSGRSGV
jgi:hypothetical protein